MNKRAWCFALSLLLLPLCGCAPRGKEVRLFAMDTLMELQVYGERADEALEQGQKEIRRLEGLLSAQTEGSEVDRIGREAPAPVEVSDPLLRQLAVAAQVSERSGGAFDLSVFPLVKAWGFADGEYRVPEESEIKALLPLVDYRRIQVEGNTVCVDEGMTLDFGAIAKGYTSQALAELFRGLGVESAMVSLGGNVQLIGGKPDGSDWTVGLQDPRESGGLFGMLSLRDTAVITSGDYQRVFEREGERFHHILDPHTGHPAKSGLISVTVICSDGTTSDALSTALFVLGEEGAIAYQQAYGGFEMVLVTDDLRVLMTPPLRDRFTEVNEGGQYTYAVIGQ